MSSSSFASFMSFGGAGGKKKTGTKKQNTMLILGILALIAIVYFYKDVAMAVNEIVLKPTKDLASGIPGQDVKPSAQPTTARDVPSEPFEPNKSVREFAPKLEEYDLSGNTLHPLTGKEIQPKYDDSYRDMDIFANAVSSPEACPTTYTRSTGCIEGSP